MGTNPCFCGATIRRGQARARRAQGRYGECEESQDSQAYRPRTACGPAGAYTRGRFRRCTEDFRDGLDCQLLIAGAGHSSGY